MSEEIQTRQGAELIGEAEFVYSFEFGTKNLSEDKIKYWCGRAEKDLLTECRAFVSDQRRSGVTGWKCTDVKFEVDPETSRGRYKATMVLTKPESTITQNPQGTDKCESSTSPTNS